MTDDKALVTRPDAPELTPFEVIERVIASGDIAKMDPQARVAFYWRTCESLGLNPLTQPFSYLNLDGKIVLYARKDATEQLRRVNRVSVFALTEKESEDGTFTVTAQGRLPDGREDAATGIVFIKGLSGQALANAKMKAETKAKRRLTLSLVGLGFMDESEVEGLGEPVVVDHTTGEIVQQPKPTLLEAVRQQTETLTAATPTVVEIMMTEAPAIMAEPMTVDASAHVPSVEPEDEPDDVGISEGALVPIPDDAAELLAEVAHAPAPSSEPPALTLQALADLARVAGAGKLKFAVALECVPADVGKRIEAMTDLQRYELAVTMGLLSQPW
jgi:hypothetical protein